jgi:hypothetical protein
VKTRVSLSLLGRKSGTRWGPLWLGKLRGRNKYWDGYSSKESVNDSTSSLSLKISNHVAPVAVEA